MPCWTKHIIGVWYPKLENCGMYEDECIAWTWICDGHYDCSDGSDEDETLCNSGYSDYTHW